LKTLRFALVPEVEPEPEATCATEKRELAQGCANAKRERIENDIFDERPWIGQDAQFRG